MSNAKRVLTAKEMIYIRTGLQLKIDSTRRAINSATNSESIKAILTEELQEVRNLQDNLHNLELPL